MNNTNGGLWFVDAWTMGAFILLLFSILIFSILILFIVCRSKNVKEQNLRLKQTAYRKIARIELQKKQLYSSNKQLQHILDVRQNVIAQLSHELRASLTSILGPVKKIQQASHGEEAETVSMIVRNVERSLHLAEQLPARDAREFIEPEKMCELLLSQHDKPSTVTVADDDRYSNDLPLTKFVSKTTSDSSILWRNEVISLVEQHFHDADFGTTAAAKAIFTSERSLQRKFRQEFNMSFKDYVIQFRFEQAKLMLRQGDRISDVALSCGFNDPSYFSARFKNSFGVTPSQFVASVQRRE